MPAPKAARRRIVAGADIAQLGWEDEATGPIDADPDWMKRTPTLGRRAPRDDHDTIVDPRPPVAPAGALVMSDTTDAMVPWPSMTSADEAIVACRVVEIREDSVVVARRSIVQTGTRPVPEPPRLERAAAAGPDGARSPMLTPSALAPTVVDAAPGAAPPPSIHAFVHRPALVSAPPAPETRERSVPPMVVSEPPLEIPRRRLWPGFMLAALVCAAGVALWLVWPRPGDLVVRLRTPEGAPVVGADIFVDGRRVCDANPCRLADLEPGRRTVEALVPGRPVARAKVDVPAGGIAEIWLELAAVQVVEADAAVVGARLEIDGADRGPLPLRLDDLQPGRHLVRITAPGHQPFERTIELGPGQRLDLGLVPLEAEPARLTVELTTPGSQVVLVDARGRRDILGGPWPMSLQLEPGTYDLIATRAGFDASHERLEVRTGESRRVPVALRPSRTRLPASAPEPESDLEPNPYVGR